MATVKQAETGGSSESGQAEPSLKTAKFDVGDEVVPVVDGEYLWSYRGRVEWVYRGGRDYYYKVAFAVVVDNPFEYYLEDRLVLTLD